ncbi:hypothetical protein FRC06_010415 [Ceratobasidium sp. 370]|nr:hypothetical protein FRC06_010415 [Ceratobasidium sp. 370]
MAPYVRTLCDYPECAVAVSHTSPVIHHYTPYPQLCIPTTVPNPEAHLPNQLNGQVPPGQCWARPMPDEASAKSCRTSIQQTHPRRQSSFDHGAHPTGYVPAQSHLAASPPTLVQAYTPAVPPVAYQNYHAPAQHQVQPQHHPEPHPCRTEPQPYRTKPQQYYADRVQHQVDPQPQYQNAISDQSHGLSAPHEHADHQQATQTASFETFDSQLDAEDLLLNTPCNFEAPGDLEVPVRLG